MVSKEIENFLRIVYLNYSVAIRALTTFFDKLHPDLSADLHITGNKASLKQLLHPSPGRKRVLYQGQWNILYPPTEKKELKQLTTNLEEMIKIKGGNLERLFGKSKQNIIGMLYERLNNCDSEVDTLKLEPELLQNKWNKQEKDHIPLHIRAQHEQEISDWEQDKKTFDETRAIEYILESLYSKHCIVVTGSSGCGKSSNIHHAALHLRDKYGYEIIPVIAGPSDIINYYKENIPQVFVVDDICGKETISKLTLQIWRDYSENLEKIFSNEKNTSVNTNPHQVSGQKLLVSCRLHIFKESQFQRITLLTKKECNILSSDLCLLSKERMFIMQKYLPDNIIDTLMPLVGDLDFFPLICKMSKNKTLQEVKKLFTDPVDIIERNIHCIISESKLQFCAIVLCIVFDDGFRTDWLKLTSTPETKRAKFEHIVKELSNEMSRNYLKDCFRTLNGTYLKQKGTRYIMIHGKIYKMAAIICGQQLTECFIKYTPSIFIRDHFIFESVTEVLTNDDLIVISKDQEEEYFERLLCDLKQHVITSTFHNSQLIFRSFIENFISFLVRSDDAKALLKKLEVVVGVISRDNEQQLIKLMSTFCTTPLIEVAAESPLFLACDRGHKDIVELLLENNSDVSKCNIYKDSPLYAACQRGRTDIVKLLLQSDANVSECYSDGVSPLVVACKEGHTETLELLLQNNSKFHSHDID
ncbi:uncharacterized protein LOC134695294 [Mytilus trossulus]|uniref:uncharacterized protein LOC134695294 n=1 Tax=Mytilus trossulus TaxID=6551 RepID=UPI003006069B